MNGGLIDSRYEVVRDVARGGMCAIRAARHVHTGRVVAIKTLLDSIDDPSIEQRLLQEARALELCRAPNVVEVLDAGVDRRPYVVLEMLEGRALDNLLTARQRLPLRHACAIVLDLLAALEVVHARGLVHRDVKPANLFISRAGDREVVKLIDFGVAHVPARPDGHALTSAGDRLGTVDYMAPEQLLGETIGPPADLYAAMVVLFEAASGQMPFPGGPHEVLRKGASQRPAPKLSALVAEAVALDEVFRRALAFEPEERISSARELASAIRNAMDGEVAAGSILEPVALPAPKQARVNARAPYVTPVRVVDGTSSFDGHCADISAGGLLVTLRQDPPREKALGARFCLPISGKVIQTDVAVRWQREAHGHRAVGLQFTNLGTEARAEIERFVTLAGAG